VPTMHARPLNIKNLVGSMVWVRAEFGKKISPSLNRPYTVIKDSSDCAVAGLNGTGPRKISKEGIVQIANLIETTEQSNIEGELEIEHVRNKIIAIKTTRAI
jgi:hypothetical protein